MMHLARCGVGLVFTLLVANENQFVSSHNCVGSFQNLGQYNRVYSDNFETSEDCEKQCGYVSGEAEAICKAAEGTACTSEAAVNIFVKVATLGVSGGTDGLACTATGGLCQIEESLSFFGLKKCEEYCDKEFPSEFHLTQGNINATRDAIQGNLNLTRQVLIKGQSEIKNNLAKLSESIANNNKELIAELILAQERIIDNVVEEIKKSESNILDSIIHSKDEVLRELEQLSNTSLTLLNAIKNDIDVLEKNLHYVQHITLYGDVFEILDTIETRYAQVQHDSNTGLIVRNYESDQYMEAVTDANDGMLIGIQDIRNMLITGNGKNWAKSKSIYEENPGQFCSAKWFHFFSLKLTKSLFHYRNGRRMRGHPLPASHSEKQYHDEHLSHYSEICQCSHEDLPTINNRTAMCNTNFPISTLGDVCQVECWGEVLDVVTCEVGGQWTVDEILIDRSDEGNWICKAIHGGWSSYGQCSRTCKKNAVQTRTCTNPEPKYGGNSCSGSSSRSCNQNIGCPLPGPVYILAGGLGDSPSGSRDFAVYHPTVDNVDCSILPPLLNNDWYYQTSFYHNQTVYLCGGWNTGSICISHKTGTNGWKTHTLTISRNSGPSSVVLNNRLYLIGGTTSYDDNSPMSTSLPLTPRPALTKVPNLDYEGNYPCTAKLDEDTLVVTGGYKWEDTWATVATYNVKTRRYKRLPSLQDIRYSHGCVVVEKDNAKWIIVAGGYWANEDYGSTLRSTEMLKWGGNEWVSLGDLNEDRHAHSMVFTQHGIMVIGGEDNNDNKLTSVELLDWGSKTWSVVQQSLNKPRSNFGGAVEIPASMFGCTG